MDALRLAMAETGAGSWPVIGACVSVLVAVVLVGLATSSVGAAVALGLLGSLGVIVWGSSTSWWNEGDVQTWPALRRLVAVLPILPGLLVVYAALSFVVAIRASNRGTPAALYTDEKYEPKLREVGGTIQVCALLLASAVNRDPPDD